MYVPAGKQGESKARLVLNWTQRVFLAALVPQLDEVADRYNRSLRRRERVVR